jgi:hypothetical protein
MPQHLFSWRKAAREGRLVLPLGCQRAEEEALFVPVIICRSIYLI